MVWRNWSVIVVLLLANYLVFSVLATWVFPVPPVTPIARTPMPTFTPGGKAFQQVEPLKYEFLTPSPTITPTRRPGATGTPATRVPATVVATSTPATPSAPETPGVETATPAASETPPPTVAATETLSVPTATPAR